MNAKKKSMALPVPEIKLTDSHKKAIRRDARGREAVVVRLSSGVIWSYLA